MSIEDEIKRSEMMCFEEVDRYELAVSYRKLKEFMSDAEVDETNEKIEELNNEIDSLQDELTDSERINEDLQGEIDKLKEELGNVRNIQR